MRVSARNTATASCFGVSLDMALAAERGVAPEAVAEAFHAFETGSSSVQPLTAAAVSNQSIQESMRLLLMVRAYQVHLGARQRSSASA